VGETEPVVKGACGRIVLIDGELEEADGPVLRCFLKGCSQQPFAEAAAAGFAGDPEIGNVKAGGSPDRGEDRRIDDDADDRSTVSLFRQQRMERGRRAETVPDQVFRRRPVIVADVVRQAHQGRIQLFGIRLFGAPD